MLFYLYELCHTIYKVLDQECEKQERKLNFLMEQQK